jgi:U4/U6.U5 tri-snRNP-associated protein 1
VEGDDDEEERQPPKGSILDELERTATASVKKRKRRSDGDDEDPDSNRSMGDSAASALDDTHKRRARFDEIMEKGNEQTAKAFRAPVKETVLSSTIDDEEPDDNFLNEALAKARRLRKLRELSGPKGADAVAQAVLDSQGHATELNQSTNMGGVTFTVDETREFSRALQARETQEERQKAKKQQLKTAQVVNEVQTKRANEDVKMEDGAEKEQTEEDMAELAKQIKEDVEDHIGIGIDGTAAVAPVGRGMAGVLSMLRHTGEISGRNAGREELRGRAKDERTYEDYAPLDLKSVVRIGQGATEKDKELASREIKLDYRDEHGRLLTRKEAYRNLCYQFHGHGSSAKNEERRLRQIEREQAEARIASRQATGAGSLGALRATQKATGKAFIIHKT